MEVVYSHCCGLDVHKKSIAACATLWPENRRVFGNSNQSAVYLCAQVYRMVHLYWRKRFILLKNYNASKYPVMYKLTINSICN